MVVVAVFLAFALASIALSPRLETGLEQKIVLPRDSYLQDYFDSLAEYLRVGPPLYFVVKDYNYSLESRQTNQLCSISQCNSNSLLNEISRASQAPETSYIAKPAASWLDDFLVWLSPEAFGCCRKFTNGSYCPPDDQPPCCTEEEDICDLDGICKDCTTCFRHSDLVHDRPSTAQFREKLPWFLNALPSADCAKGGHGAYTNSVDLNGYETGVIQVMNNHFQCLEFSHHCPCISDDTLGSHGYDGDSGHPTQCSFCCEFDNVNRDCCRILRAHITCFPDE